MRLQSLALFSVSALAGPALFADPGALDRFDCHDHAQTGVYHCHGDEALASLGGVAVGLGLRSSIWTYGGESAVNLFAGPSIEVEAGLGSFAVQAGYHYKTLANSDDDISLIGWDLGAKIGRSVSRYGAKYYLAGGYFYESLEREGDDDHGISGFYLGGGGGYNWDSIGADIQLDWHTPAGYEDYWDEQDNPADMQVISVRAFLSYRF